MLLQWCNIVAGFVLMLPQLQSHSPARFFDKLADWCLLWQVWLGLITLSLGLLGLCVRGGILPEFIPNLGASFPQSLPAILIGALLALPKLKPYPAIASQIERLIPQAFVIGLVGMLVGTGSLLFGCFISIFCQAPF